ncbi:glycoside hydrolase domain-containing protein [Paenibacillus sp. 32352]|uniref:glycoside hydrolase domain-containing protein n=1 Tax=Paenibacillus sp. 32352 TaxID=1969111 RepID=UPI0009ABC411|nr:glycoside hydrolase domain-containing protein [Paenibacillus sp. 32352]
MDSANRKRLWKQQILEIASQAEEPYYVFGEERNRPILWLQDFPEDWLERSQRREFAAVVRPGEFYVLQVVLFATRCSLIDVQAEFTDLVSSQGSRIPASGIKCFAMGGRDAYGQPFKKKVTVRQGGVQSLWIGISVPRDVPAASYSGVWTFSACGSIQPFTVKLTVAGQPLDDAGDSETWRHSRLRWLNSDLAIDEEVTAPYIPVTWKDRRVGCLGRELTLNDYGFPEAIESRFNDAVDGLTDVGKPILAEPIRFAVQTPEGEAVWESRGVRFERQTDSRIGWSAQSHCPSFEMRCQGELEYDGYVRYEVTLKAKKTVHVSDMWLDIPYAPGAARYGMGLGHKGGFLPEHLDWHWDPSKHQHAMWIGDVNAGLRLRLLDPEGRRPFVNIYYKHRPLTVPDSWGNRGKGGVKLLHREHAAVLRAYSGERMMEQGEELRFVFDLMITPLKAIEMNAHWNNRYLHRLEGKAVMDHWQEQALASGANIINIHHGADAHPFINYPFLETETLARFVAEAHNRNLKVKLYYTVREISDHMTELQALRSLGDEIFPRPNPDVVTSLWQGDAAKWVREHLGDDIIPAWKHEFKAGKYTGEIDAAIVTDGTSRLVNYYVEGLNWLLKHTDMDGLYIDDTAYDRFTMRRVRKILDRTKPGSLIDFHTWNHMNERAGFVNNADLYMELFPYLDSLWIGEGFKYNEVRPEYWLVEISGIPFGLMGEMLGDGNPWRGMIYGMSNRLGWFGHSPEGLWKLWDRFGIQDAQMLGYWHPDNPIAPSRKDVAVTVYHKQDQMLIAAASWADEPLQCSLHIDWGQLGWEPDSLCIEVPAIDNIQDAIALESLQAISLQPQQGLIIIVRSGSGNL